MLMAENLIKIKRRKEPNQRESRKPRIQNPAEKMIETRGRRMRDNVAKEKLDF